MPKFIELPVAEWAETKEDCEKLIAYFDQWEGPIAIDTETTGLDVIRDRILFWSLATEERRICLPASALYYMYGLFDKERVWCLANAKFDMHMLANHGVRMKGEIWDIVVMDAMEDDTRPHGLKEQAYRDFGVDWGEFKDLFLNADYLVDRIELQKEALSRFRKMTLSEKLMFVWDEEPDIVIDYATCDAYFTYLLFQLRKETLSRIELPTDIVPELRSLLDYYEIIELPFTQALWEMERIGTPLSTEVLNKLDTPLRTALQSSLFSMNELVEELGLVFTEAKSGKVVPFKPSSTDHVIRILYSEEGYGIRAPAYTSGGASGKAKPSTRDEHLKRLLDRNIPDKAREFLKHLLSYREVAKLHGTYVRDMEKKHLRNGRIHCSFNQSGTRTGRLSANNPNLQNIPARTELGKRIREAFVASEGYLLVVADYPQIEFRIAAALAGEEAMMEDIRKGWDVHNANTARIFADRGVTYEKVVEARKADKTDAFTDEHRTILGYRDQAKAVGLGTLYGEGKYKMASDLGIDVEVAGNIQERFRASYPNINKFEEDIHGFAREYGFTFTMLGRIRRLHRIGDDYHGGIVAAEERQAFNTAIQGSGAEIMKLAILRCVHDPVLKELGYRPLITVHDELVGEAPEEVAHEAYDRVIELMSDPFNWGPIKLKYPVPIAPDGSVAPNWSEAK